MRLPSAFAVTSLAAAAVLQVALATGVQAQAARCANPNALGVARTVEIDTTGGPGFGLEQYKAYVAANAKPLAEFGGATARSMLGQQVMSTPVMVTVNRAARVASFTANPSNIDYGDTSELRWSTSRTPGGVRITAFQDVDIAARHGESFCRGNNTL